MVIWTQVGLRLMAGQWLSEWLCHEQGLRWPSKDTSKDISKDTSEKKSKDISSDSSNNRSQTSPHCESDDIPHRTKRPAANFKLVLAEPLPNSPHSHVNTFLKAHGGPGLQVGSVCFYWFFIWSSLTILNFPDSWEPESPPQHIGLSTVSIAPTVGLLAARGAMFRKPPPTYYHLQVGHSGGDTWYIHIMKWLGGGEEKKIYTAAMMNFRARRNKSRLLWRIQKSLRSWAFSLTLRWWHR